MNLKQALNDFRETLKTSRINPIDGDARTYPARDMMRRQAAVQLPSKRNALAESLKPVSFLVFIDGPGKDKAISLAAEQAEVVSVDISAVLDGVVESVEATIPKSREFTLNSFFILVVVKTKSEVATLVEDYVKKFIGSDFLVASITQKVIQAATEELTGDSSVVPVFVAGISKDFSDAVGPKLLGGKYMYFEASEDVEQKEIIKLFNQIKKIVKNQKDD